MNPHLTYREKQMKEQMAWHTTGALSVAAIGLMVFIPAHREGREGGEPGEAPAAQDGSVAVAAVGQQEALPFSMNSRVCWLLRLG